MINLNMADEELFKKFLAGECTKEEVDKLLLYLRENPQENFETVSEKVWAETNQEDEDVPYEAAYLSVYNKLSDHLDKETDDYKTISFNTALRKPLFSSTLLKVAAVVILMISVALVLYLNYLKEDFASISTTYAETREVVLPDGSQVILNARSRLKYPSDWDARAERVVWLQGEGYFSIRKTDENRRFLVYTEDAQIEVLGTEFNVNNRRGNTRVVLNSGSVKLKINDLDDEVQMSPGELAEFSRTERKIKQQVVNPQQYSAWTNNKLIFDGTSFEEIALLLEDNYGIKVKFDTDEMKHWYFSGSTPGDNLDILFQSLEKLYPVSIERSNNKIFFRAE